MWYRDLLKGIIFVALLFGAAGSCLGQDERPKESNLEREFCRANDHYEKGEYPEAIAEYEKILAAGFESGPLYYNLGNSYFKAGLLGRALLNYERALRLIPRDADLKANLGFVSNSIKGRIPGKKGLENWRPFRLYSGNLTVNELLWLASGMYVLVVVLLALFVYRPDIRHRLLTLILLVFLFGCWNGFVLWNKASKIGKEAAVISPEAESRYGPFDSATVFFKLYGGMKVEILNKKGDWCKIERPDGKVGWVRKKEIEII